MELDKPWNNILVLVNDFCLLSGNSVRYFNLQFCRLKANPYKLVAVNKGGLL